MWYGGVRRDAWGCPEYDCSDEYDEDYDADYDEEFDEDEYNDEYDEDYDIKESL